MKKIKYTLIALAAIVASVIAVKIASANGSYFITPVRTAAATSTTSSISPGIATTTLTYDSLVLGSIYATDRASLLVQDTASNSAAVIGIALQYSQDGIDWYDNNLSGTSSIQSVTNITVANTFTLQGNAVASSSLKIISVPTPTRFVRAVFSGTTGTSSLWAQFVPVRQVTQ